jgi:hypothetical protein
LVQLLSPGLLRRLNDRLLLLERLLGDWLLGHRGLRCGLLRKSWLRG